MTVQTARHDAPFPRLTPKQERFVREYVRCGNAKRSAALAGYGVRSAKQIGHSLLQKSHVRFAIEELRGAGQPEPDALSQESILRKLLDLAHDPAPLIRLNALKEIARIQGVSDRWRDPRDSGEDEERRDAEPMDRDERELCMVGMSKERAANLTDREFETWVCEVREEAEERIRLADRYRTRPEVPAPAEQIQAPSAPADEKEEPWRKITRTLDELGF